ncbi:hypothetical protein QG516_21505 [Pedobacter gandavensis]|uniref:Lipoprotein n=2 Tax=Pedobacter TaxID=84567 RepID=A0A127VET3_9SPHI|nr:MULTISPECIES: hypothetical protein [Pedobacter]AMP99757.1 hypothetical protein AY601_2881 [Pedobacter cryoconitis]RQO79020.1 hypothetical protein DBR40_04670 [Pedobacter sp. KBW01]WGQ09092.1 hypothetical protein QG516_21505 [Pedobacter gandavensis]SHG05410.1 hypothetical protein SAMN04488522_104301 [Pedobacter caeni]
MKKTLIIAAMSSMLFAACSNETKKEATTDSSATETAPAVDTTAIKTDSATVAKDTVAMDSAEAAHGHKH